MTKKIKVISTADEHFGKDDPEKLYNELKLLEDTVDKEKPLLFTIDGDLFHRVLSMNEEASRYVFKFIDDMMRICLDNHIEFRIIRGTRSHDFRQLNMLKKYETQYPNFKIYETATVEDIKLNDGSSLNILFLPEEYPKDSVKFYDKFLNVKPNTYDMIHGHGMIDFVGFTGYESDFERTIKTAPIFDKDVLCKISRGPVIFGHVHNYNSYEDQIYYTTSYSRYSFGDKGDKGFLDIDLELDDNGNVSDYKVNFVENTMAPTYVTINLDTEDLKNSEEKTAYITKATKNYDHIRLTSTDKDNTEIIKKITESNPSIKVQIKNKNNNDDSIESKYQFLIDKTYDSTEENIQKFININENVNIPLSIIREIINEETDYDPEKIKKLMKYSS